MNWRTGLLLYLLGLCVYSIPAFFQKSPGYMDAEYYYSVALSLKEGSGFNEMLLWNYLDDPQGLPHPSNAYWMPFPAIVAWLGMVITSSSEFMRSRIIFLAIAALVPPLTAALAWRITQRLNSALLAGALAVLPGFYLPYLGTSDAFGICMVLGAMFFIALDQYFTKTWPATRLLLGLAVGVLAGGLYLTRADGLIWLLCGLAAIAWRGLSCRPRSSMKHLAASIAACLAGYLLVAGPWLARNLSVFGTLFTPGGSRLLWMSHYNQVFTYPADSLTITSWLATGYQAILQGRLWSLGQNFQTAVAIQGSILLLPLVVLGFIMHRHNPLLWTGLAGWGATWVVMTVIFPYAGARGGFFHSGAAWQPLWWAVASSGLQSLVDWGARRRGWQPNQAWRFLSSGTVLLLILLTSLVSYQRVSNSEQGSSRWDGSQARYRLVEQKLQGLGAQPDEVVLVNNAPGYYAANRRPAISIPYAEIENVLAAAGRFQGRYLVLELDQIPGSPDLYLEPGDRQGLKYLGSISDTSIYLIEN